MKMDGYRLAKLAAILGVRDALTTANALREGTEMPLASHNELIEEAMELWEHADAAAASANEAYADAEKEKEKEGHDRED